MGLTIYDHKLIFYYTICYKSSKVLPSNAFEKSYKTYQNTFLIRFRALSTKIMTDDLKSFCVSLGHEIYMSKKLLGNIPKVYSKLK